MTDKVQKIREEVARLHGNPYYMMAVKDALAIIDSLQEEPVSEDLKQAIHNAIFALDERKGYTFKLEDMFMAGAQWQKEQMIKSVLASQEMTCIQVAHRLIGGSWNLACPTDKIGLKSNDKVKVIIIKDE